MGRIFVSASDIQGKRLRLEGPPARHILQVMRKKPGDVIEVTDGQGRDYTVRIADISDGVLKGTVETSKEQARSNLDVHLYQAIPKASRMDYVIEKSVELGVRSIHPLITKRTIVKTEGSSDKLERWRRLSAQAVAQCGSAFDCPVHEPVTLETASQNFIPEKDLTIVAWEEEKKTSLKSTLSGQPLAGRRINLVIGPEGGLEASEVKMLSARGARVVSLGPQVLRTDTAPLMLLSALLYESFL